VWNAIPDSQWSSSQKACRIRDTEKSLELILNLFRGKVCMGYSGLNNCDDKNSGSVKGTPIPVLPELQESVNPKPDAFTDWMRSKQYGENAIITCMDCLRTFFRFFAEKKIEEISN
jgi:hypothetical protein